MEGKRALLICIEGLDSCGKGTQVKIITEYYEKLNKKVKHIHFPMYGYSEFSKIISKFLQGEFGNIDEVDPLFIANIYAMDRFVYKEQLMKDLLENDVVIIDRYIFSNMAYQGAKIEDTVKSQELIKWIYKFEVEFLNLPYPDRILYLNVPINIIEERLKNERVGEDRDYLEGKKDIHEVDINFQKKVGDVYLTFQDFLLNYYVIKTHNENGLFSPSELFETYKKLL